MGVTFLSAVSWPGALLPAIRNCRRISALAWATPNMTANDHDDGLRTAAYWTLRANEAQALAQRISDPTAKAIMEDIAHKYELMAQQAARREMHLR
jgi:hypothetical protein